MDFRLCLCFDIGFGVCVCVSAWISSWALGFVCISGLCFGCEFQPLSTFRAGFLLVILNLLVSIWVAHISTLFFGFSDLGFAHISARFFWFFCSFFFFLVLLHWFLMGFGHSGGVAVMRWFLD